MCGKSRIQRLLEVLVRRSVLPNELEGYLANLDRGRFGEEWFATEVLGGLTFAHLVLRDLRLRLNQNHFQIDALLLCGKQVIVFEIKNWSGTFDYVDGQIVSCRTAKPYKNPVEQLGRCVANLQYLLDSWGFEMEVVGRIVFVNSTFCLYHAPVDQPFLFVPELAEWVKGLNRFPGWVDESHHQLAEMLAARHCPAEVDRELLPEIRFSDLQKGIDCMACGSFLTEVMGQKILCRDCQGVERTGAAIIRFARELQLLFPEMKVNSCTVAAYCGNKLSRQRISRNLGTHFAKRGNTKGTYFVIGTKSD